MQKKSNHEVAKQAPLKPQQPKPVKPAPAGEKAPLPKTIDGHGKECGRGY